MQVFQDFITLGLVFVFENGTTGDDDVVAFLIEFDDFEVDFFAFAESGVFDRADIDQRTGQECLDTFDIDGEAAFDAAGDDAGDGFAVVEFLFQHFPSADALGFFVRDFGFAETVFQRFQGDFNAVADGNGEVTVFIGELAGGDEALGFEPGVQDDEVFVDLYDFGLDDGAGFEFGGFDAFFKKLSK